MSRVSLVLWLFLLCIAMPAQVVHGQPAQEDRCMVLFYSPSCPHCENVEAYLDDTNRSVSVDKYEVGQNAELFNDYADTYDLPVERRGAVPTAFIGQDYFVGDQQIIEAIEDGVGEGDSCPSAGTSEEARTTGLVSLGGLALVDAVNPCALAVLVILLTSILSKYPDKKNKVLWSGLSFTVAVFTAYFAVGMAMLAGYKAFLDVIAADTTGLYTVLGILAVALGLFNIKDWLKLGSLGFTMEVPHSWRPNMKSILRKVTSPLGAAAAGLVVSLFLLPCTSGPYFVAGGLLSQLPISAAARYLAYYNTLFVLPMLVLTGVAWSGLASVDRLAEWREQNIERLHLVAGVILVLMGLFILLGA